MLVIDTIFTVLLEDPPVKDGMVTIHSFWGSYKWPKEDYARWENRDRLERLADEDRLVSLERTLVG